MNTLFRLALIILLFFSAQTGSAQDPNFYIFLCFGQSNMEGQGTIQSQDRTVDSRFQVLQAVDCPNLERTKGNWYTAVPPLSRCWNGLSPADYFGRTLIENLPAHVKVGVVNVSVGGCRIELFDKDIYADYTDTYTDDWFQDIITAYNGNPYGYLLDLAKMAQQQGVIKGILLHQGESNSGDSQWPNKVKKIYNDLITDLALDPAGVPLLAGEVVHADQGGAVAGMNSIINKLPEVLPNSYVISSSGCTDKSDNIHFDSEGYRAIGLRYGTQMLSLLDTDIAPLGLDAKGNENGHALFQNYPNPSSRETSIGFQIPHHMKVSIKLYDLLGQEVCTLAEREFTSGQTTITPDLGELPRGSYFYTMRTEDGVVSRRLILE